MSEMENTAKKKRPRPAVPLTRSSPPTSWGTDTRAIAPSARWPGTFAVVESVVAAPGRAGGSTPAGTRGGPLAGGIGTAAPGDLLAAGGPGVSSQSHRLFSRQERQ